MTCSNNSCNSCSSIWSSCNRYSFCGCSSRSGSCGCSNCTARTGCSCGCSGSCNNGCSGSCGCNSGCNGSCNGNCTYTQLHVTIPASGVCKVCCSGIAINSVNTALISGRYVTSVSYTATMLNTSRKARASTAAAAAVLLLLHRLPRFICLSPACASPMYVPEWYAAML